MRRLARLLPLLALVAAAGCNEYHYYDITVSFNQNTASGGFGPNEAARIQVGVFTVSGADSDELRIGPNNRGLPLSPGGATLGVIEFSTFADSGTLNFKFEAYCRNPTTTDTKVGEGTTSIQVTSSTTVSGALSVNKTGDFASAACQ
jgi:hypothetical protein